MQPRNDILKHGLEVSIIIFLLALSASHCIHFAGSVLNIFVCVSNLAALSILTQR